MNIGARRGGKIEQEVNMKERKRDGYRQKYCSKVK